MHKKLILLRIVFIVLLLLIVVTGYYFYTFLPRVDPSLTVSFIALIVSAVSFYYSQFQGPVLMVIEDGELFRLPEGMFPNREYPLLPQASRNLFVANDGNRVGDVTLSELSFIPEDEFKPHYKGLDWKPYLISEKNEPESDVFNKPIVIPPKDGRAVNIRFNIYIQPRKNLDNYEFPLEVNIRTFLGQKLEEQRGQLTHMIESLERKGKLGNLELEYRVTRRLWGPWFSWKTPPHVMLRFTVISTNKRPPWEVKGDLYSDQVQSLKNTLKDWDNLPQTVNSVLNHLLTTVTSWSNRLKDLKNWVPDECRNAETLRNLRPGVGIYDLLRDLEGSHPLVQSLFKRDPQLWSKIRQLDGDLRGYNDLHSILASKDRVISDNDFTQLSRIMATCRQDIDEIFPKIVEIRANLEQLS